MEDNERKKELFRTSGLLYDLALRAGLVNEDAVEGGNSPVRITTITPHSEVSHLALFVGALCSGLDDLGVRLGTRQEIRLPLPSRLWKPNGNNLQRDRTETEKPNVTVSEVDLERLRTAHATAIVEIEHARQQSGQLTTGINGEVGASILAAGALALMVHSGDEKPKQFVVAAPPGTGKTSHAIALMAATVRTADDSDQSKPYGCLFVVDQIKKADDMFLQINALLPKQVAVWTSDHDVNSSKVTQLFVPLDRRFHVDQLEQHAIAVVTQAFLRGPRGDKARQVVRGDHSVPRALTIFDEQTKEVDVFDIKQSQAIAVKERIERDLRRLDIRSKMEPLLSFLHELSKKTGNSIDTPNDDPKAWQAARELAWFASEEAEQFVLNNGRDIEHLDEVFGFAAQMHRNYAFIFRFGGGENGSQFMGYVPAATPTGNSVLLDASADIDSVSDLCSWRTHVAVPQVRYDNLHIVHAEHYTQKNLTEFFQKETNRRKYADDAKKLILEIMPPGMRGLIVCKKRLVDQGRFPKDETEGVQIDTEATNRFPWDFEGRHLAVTWWGGHGIGANDWKEADFVFQFGEHILPKRTMFATVQGLRGQKATMGLLSITKSANSNPEEVHLATEGHLLRFMKQMGMRGRARSFDSNGVCGKQVLVLTCDFERLLVHADQLFPGATLSKWGRNPQQFKKLRQPEKLMEVLTDLDQPEVIDASDIAGRLGVAKWGAVSTNVMTSSIKERLLPNLGWAYVSKRGPGGGSSFVKRGTGVLKAKALVFDA